VFKKSDADVYKIRHTAKAECLLWRSFGLDYHP
jgi:hypothetical protein